MTTPLDPSSPLRSGMTGGRRRLTMRFALSAAGSLALAGASLVVATPAFASSPTISVSSTSGTSGEPVTFSGSGWIPFDSVAVALEGTASSFVCQLAADSTGTLTTQSCIVPTGLPAASYTVNAHDSSTSVNGATFTVHPGITVAGANGQPTVEVGRGQVVGLSGSGFGSGATITSATVSNAQGATPVTLTPAPTINTQGSFSATSFTVPTTIKKAGPLAVTVKDSDGNTATYSVDLFKATIAATPSTGVSGQLFSISGSGWPGNDSVGVRLVSSGGATFVCNVGSGSTGAISAQSCTIPSDLPAGSYTLNASDPSVTVNGATFTVRPAASLTNSGGVPVSFASPGTTIFLSGSGFAADSSITSVTVGTTVVTTSPASIPTSSGGAFGGATFTVPSLKAGNYTVAVEDAADNTATVRLFVT